VPIPGADGGFVTKRVDDLERTIEAETRPRNFIDYKRRWGFADAARVASMSPPVPEGPISTGSTAARRHSRRPSLDPIDQLPEGLRLLVERPSMAPVAACLLAAVAPPAHLFGKV
jgi:hypothetical protein